jgi:hypothetical protein
LRDVFRLLFFSFLRCGGGQPKLSRFTESTTGQQAARKRKCWCCLAVFSGLLGAMLITAAVVVPHVVTDSIASAIQDSVALRSDDSQEVFDWYVVRPLVRTSPHPPSFRALRSLAPSHAIG